MKNVLLIVKKEFNRFFKDRRMILMIFLPGLLIFCLYTLLGTVMENSSPPIDPEYKFTAYAEVIPDEFDGGFAQTFEFKEFESAKEAKQSVIDGSLDVVLEFVNFSSDTENMKPEVRIYYNSSNNTSLAGYSLATQILSGLNAFTINSTQSEVFDLVEADEQATSLIAMLIPLLMFSLFSFVVHVRRARIHSG